jgi:hypothetical protein
MDCFRVRPNISLNHSEQQRTITFRIATGAGIAGLSGIRFRHVTVLRDYLGDNLHEDSVEVFKGTRAVIQVSFEKGTTLSASNNISLLV